GLVVEPGDASGFANAILRLLDDDALYQSARCNMPAVKADLSWERVLEPLVERCRSGRGIAAPKRARLVPLLRRTGAYLLAHSWQQAVTRERT
ncbi:MAG: hypothetical protein WD939_03930, partial [Dehalococcoidia bacterium]